MKTKHDFVNGVHQGIHRSSGESSETVFRHAPIQMIEDFLGASFISIPDIATAAERNWKKSTVGGGAVAGKSDNAGGAIECALTNTSEEQLGALHRANHRQNDISKKLVIETRFRFTVVPTSGTKFFIGLAADHNKVAQSITQLVGFSADGSGLLYADCDDATTDSQATTGTTLAADEWVIGRIEIYDVTDIKFYLDGSPVATGTTFAFAATGADAILQEFASLYKASGTSVGTLEVDYFKVWAERA